MQLFECQSCGQQLFFESHQCTRCGAQIAFLPDTMSMSALQSAEGAEAPDVLVAPQDGADGARKLYRHCRNRIDFGACNWAVSADEDGDYCRSCRLNEKVPNLSVEKLRRAWEGIERAKRRWLFTVFNLGLAVEPKSVSASGLAFSFLADSPGKPRVMTGHQDGRITINVAEADDVKRESMRVAMGEDYRTLIGHFRHESGHYFWERLVGDTGTVDAFRTLFGDERADYGIALERHHREGPPSDWEQNFVSAYATAHPWEDWAETWAHYLHMMETLETTKSYGLSLAATGPAGSTSESARVEPGSFESMVETWIPLTVALNALNRSMGLADFYPFLTPRGVVQKLRFVHDVVLNAPRRLSRSR